MSVTLGTETPDTFRHGNTTVNELHMGPLSVWSDGNDALYVADWSNGWGDEWSVVPGSLGTHGSSDGYGTMSTTSRLNDRYGLSLAGFENSADYDITIGLDVPSGANTAGELLFRWYGSKLGRNGYALAWQRYSPGKSGLYRYGDGTWNQLGTVPDFGGNPAWLRLIADGNNLSVKAWKKTDPEPDWQITVADNTYATGHIGLSVYAILNSARTETFTDFVIK